MTKRTPTLVKGQKIKFLDKISEVVEDRGDEIDVLCEGAPDVWEWEYMGFICEVIANP